MLLSTSLKAETVAGTASSKKCKSKKQETEQKKNHQKKTDTGLRNQWTTQGVSWGISSRLLYFDRSWSPTSAVG